MNCRRHQVLRLGDVFVVTLASGGTEISLARTVVPLFEQDHCNVLVDLQELGTLDSRRIGELIMYKEMANRGGGDLKLLKPKGPLRDMLEAVKLDVIFDIYDEFGAALAAFEEAPSGSFDFSSGRHAAWTGSPDSIKWDTTSDLSP